MTWILAILIVLALGGVAVVAAGKGAPMSEVYDDRPDALVPAGRPLVADDLRRVRFSLALRGYRMSEVDTLLDRLAGEMEAARSDAAARDDEAAGDSGATGAPEAEELRAEGAGAEQDGDTGEGRGDRLHG